MNKMAEVAKLFDKELEEKFTIIDDNGVATSGYFSEKGLIYFTPNGEETTIMHNTLSKLLTGTYRIKKTPWKAKETEQYYVPNIYGEMKYTFPGAVLDLPTKPVNFYLRGLMCKTPEQAEELSKLLIKTARQFQGFDEEQENE